MCIYQLQIDVAKSVKGDKLFHVYINHLKVLWDEIQQHRPSSANLKTIKKHKEEDMIFKLLARLGKEFENIWSSILLMQPLPSFNSVCAMIQREESSRRAMLEDY